MLRRLKKLILIIFTMALILSGIFISQKQGPPEVKASTGSTTISGTLSLPAGVVAPTDGLEGRVYLYPENGDNDASTAFTIPAGSNSITYTVTASTEASTAGYRVRYYLDKTYPGYVGSGYYYLGGTTANYNSAALLNTSSTGINLTIFTGYTVSGTIALPDGKKAPAGGLNGNVFIRSCDSGNTYNSGFNLAEGENSVNYTITVASNVPMTGCYLDYEFDNHSSYAGYVGNGYYSQKGTVSYYSDADFFDLSGVNVSGKNFTIYTGYSISGTISLPAGATAPAGGLEGNVTADSEAGNYYSHFKITSGSSTANYSLTVPVDMAIDGYNLSYYLFDDVKSNSGYVSIGYYTSEGTVSNYDSAELVDVSTGNVSNINLTLLPGIVISGTVSLPQDAEAPTEKITGSVYASPQDNNDGYSGFFTIMPGEKAVNYTVTISKPKTAAEYRLNYYLDDNNNGFLSEGYYATTGTVSDYSAASSINVGTESITGINLTILRGNTISGTIVLPSGKTAPEGGLSGEVSFYAEGGGRGYYSHFTIPAGSNSATYNVTVSTDSATSYRGSYYLYDNEGDNYPGYLCQGYYSDAGTVGDYPSSSLINISLGNISDINFTILRGTIVSGTILLPEGKTAPAGGLEGYINFFPQSGSYGYNTNFTIPEGESSASYSIALPNNSSEAKYIVSYYLNGTEYQENGYYSTEGTTADYNSAALVEIGADDVSGINLTLLKGVLVSGTIALPEGKTAPAGGLDGNIFIYSQDGAYNYNTYFSISEGKSTANYSFALPANSDEKYYLYYWLYDGNGEYETFGYYSTEGTTTDINSATPIQVGTDNISRIDLTLLEAISVPDDHGNTFDTATVISEGTNVSGQIDPAGDVDFFKFTPSQSGVYTFMTLSDYDTYGYLFDADQNQLAYDDDNGDGANFLISQQLQAGQDYYIQVKMYSTSQTGSYQLSIAEPGSLNTISGTISLPEGQTAPSGGIGGSIYVNSDNGDTSSSILFNIPEGANSTNYSITLPANAVKSGYRVRYWLNNYEDYALQGYYSTEGTTDYNSATLISLDQGSAEGINLQLINKNIISGTIVLPNGATAPAGGITGHVNAECRGEGYSADFQIPEGSSSADYSLKVPAYKESYTVSYAFDPFTDHTGLLSSGYYSLNGTTTASDSATPVDVSSGNAADINFTLLTGKTVSGTVSLPEGLTATGGTIDGQICLESQNGDNNYSDAYFSIPESGHSANYSITIPEDESNSGYYVKYFLYNIENTNYVRTGYYSTEGTTTFNSATLVNMNSGNVSGINLTLLTGNTISGTVSLPNGKTAEDDIWGEVYITPPNTGGGGSQGTSSQNGDNGYYYGVFSILAGEASGTYTSECIPVDSSISGYQVFYRLYDQPNGATYVGEGYYSTEGTTTVDHASLVNINNGSVSNINLTLLTGKVISGRIALPDGMTAPDNGIDGNIIVDPLNGSAPYNTYFYIPPGLSSADYTIIVPANVSTTGYRVSYSFNDSYPQFLEPGYYSADGTTANPDSVTLVQVAADDVSDVNLTLLAANSSSGLSASPLVQLGVNPNADNSAGMFIGLENIQDSSGAQLGNASIDSYKIEIDFDPAKVSIADPIDETNSGALFSTNIDTSTSVGKVLIARASGSSISKLDDLFFVPIRLKGSAQDLTNVSIKFLEVKDNSLHTIQVPSLESLNFQRGKISNGETGDPNIADAIAGLQYLANLKKAGYGLDDINPVNMASIFESDPNSTVAKPEVKDIIALMQYSVDLRDGYFTIRNTSSQ